MGSLQSQSKKSKGCGVRETVANTIFLVLKEDCNCDCASILSDKHLVAVLFLWSSPKLLTFQNACTVYLNHARKHIAILYFQKSLLLIKLLWLLTKEMTRAYHKAISTKDITLCDIAMLFKEFPQLWAICARGYVSDKYFDRHGFKVAITKANC